MAAPSPALIERLAEEAERELAAILAWWSSHAIDPQGGFHGEIDARNAPIADAAKGAVLNARLLWFFSAAAAHLKSAAALAPADRAHAYITAHFVDRARGGLYWSLDASGAPRDRKKHAYAQAFQLYALCAHHQASGRPESLREAHTLFALMELRYLEPTYGGYVEALAQDWTPIPDMRLSELDANAPKTMNTHLHILEAYAALHARAPTPQTGAALRRSIGVFLDRLIDADHLRLFLDNDWTDRSEAISFGHDIEASWLLWEACETLGDAALCARVKPAVVALARACLEEGLGEDGGVFNERALSGGIDRTRVWWAQAEAMVGFLNAHELTGDAAFFDAFARVWAFVKAHQRHDSGEWTWRSALDAPDPARAYKAGFWKCPYHNGRAMIETSRRLRRLRDKE